MGDLLHTVRRSLLAQQDQALLERGIETGRMASLSAIAIGSKEPDPR